MTKKKRKQSNKLDIRVSNLTNKNSTNKTFNL